MKKRYIRDNLIYVKEGFINNYFNNLKVIWISEKPLDSTSIKANSSTELYITTTSNLYNTLITK